MLFRNELWQVIEMVLHVTFWLYKQIKAPIFSHKRGSASYHGFWMAIGVMSSNYRKTVNIHPQLSQLLPELVEFYRYVKVTCAITCNKTHLYLYFFILNDLTKELKILYAIRFSNLAILQIKGPNFNICSTLSCLFLQELTMFLV